MASVSHKKKTALLFACLRGNSAIVSRLVKVPGLDINYQDEKLGETAALMASYRGHTEIVRILAETGKVDWNRRMMNDHEVGHFEVTPMKGRIEIGVQTYDDGKQKITHLKALPGAEITGNTLIGSDPFDWSKFRIE